MFRFVSFQAGSDYYLFITAYDGHQTVSISITSKVEKTGVYTKGFHSHLRASFRKFAYAYAGYGLWKRSQPALFRVLWFHYCAAVSGRCFLSPRSLFLPPKVLLMATRESTAVRTVMNYTTTLRFTLVKALERRRSCLHASS